MRRRAAVALAVPLSALMLGASGCGVIPEDWQTPALMRSEQEYDTRLPVVSGPVGEEPEITFPDIAPPTERLSGVAHKGEDANVLIRKSDLLVAHIVEYRWTEAGKGEQTSSTYEHDAPTLLPLSQMPEDLADAVINQSVGSRVVFLFPPPSEDERAQYEAMGQEAPEGASVSVVDIVARHGKGDVVEGEQTSSGGDGLPTVTDNGRAIPDITIPENTEAPKDLKAVTLIEGDGPEVTEGQQIVVQYTGVRWDDGKVFDSTWNTGLPERAAAENEDTDGDPLSFQIGVGGVIEGWDEGLVGQRVGSRVLLVIPEDKAYGKEAEERGQPAGTLVFVVDLLGAYNTAPEEEEETDAPADEGDASEESGDASEEEGGE
ncbi:FKBP-type peptidyl-prolyl cis-trans isomerase [Thermobifida cellulosilytica]|uniref:peptidylprolyl isomerase n=1 Tax=Thermobifida cellulosilytica TB100 TaxID=665004 RepID=A0A147KIW6_THECS|nr:FKBP-type peptidyl-prolyl cis-trans isomerase [Thermobifida cellulosilytica]KUP97236.1 peptidylprolyl isomerase [Thermobifida cellulosilytica TB100]